MLTSRKKRKTSEIECCSRGPVAKRIKGQEECNISTVTDSLARLKEEHQLQMRDFFLSRYPIYKADSDMWLNRYLSINHDSGETVAQYKKRITFLQDLINNSIINHDDPYSRPCAITAPKGFCNVVLRLLHALVPYLQATDFFLSKGADVRARCIMEPLSIRGEMNYVPDYRTFDCDSSENSDNFMDQEDYEFFRDHCHQWSFETLSKILEKFDFTPTDDDNVVLNVGVINKCTRRFIVVTLEFTKLSK